MKLNNDLYEYDKAAALLAILDILRRFGDVYNKREMQDKLLEEYGISLQRNTFAAKLKTLDRCGYTLRESEDGTHYIFEGREFSDAQLRVLIDCLIYNGVVGSETAKKMIAELCDLGSESLRKSCRKFQNRVIGRKQSSDIVTENLGLIQRAIAGSAKITCNYTVYNNNLNPVNKYPKDITVSPFELTLSNGRYILICAIDGEEGFTHFYIDKLCNIKNKREPSLNSRKILSALGYNDMNEYISSQPVLCGGRKEIFTLKIDNEIIDDFIVDYGSDDFRKQSAHAENDGYNTVLVVKTSADSLKRLIMPYYDKIVVLGRPEFNESINEMFLHGKHNQEMIGKSATSRIFNAYSLEEAVQNCEINDVNVIRFRGRKPYAQTDLSVLEKAYWAEWITLINVDIRGQRFPKELTELTRLNLYNCKLDIAAVTDLKNLKKLQITDITGSDINQLSKLNSIVNFEYVDSIEGRKGHTEANITDLDFLKSWKNLIQLKLYSCKALTDISALSDKTHLRNLALLGCETITDFSPLYGLKNLKVLDLTRSKISPEKIEEIQAAMPWCRVWNEEQKGKVLERKRIPALR